MSLGAQPKNYTSILLRSRAHIFYDLYLDPSNVPVVVVGEFYHLFGTLEIHCGIKVLLSNICFEAKKCS